MIGLTHDGAAGGPLGSDLLDRADVLHQRQLETEVELLRLVAEFARQHGEGTVDPVRSRLPGRERAVRLGGEGTPLVAEFAPSMLAARLQLSAYAGGRLVADVLDLEYRLPQHWAGLNDLEIRPGHARYVARKTRDLSKEEAAYVDARVARFADGRLSWSRFVSLVDAAIAAADPASAEAREKVAARDSFAKPTHSTEHGMRGFYVRADFATNARIDATVAYLAQALLALGDTSSLDQRRVKAVLIMANPTQAVRILQAFGALRDRILSEDEQDTVEAEPFDPAVATAREPVVESHVAADGPALRAPLRRRRTGGASRGSRPRHRRVGPGAPRARSAGSASPRSSIRSTRRRSTPGRSRPDIGRPCIS